VKPGVFLAALFLVIALAAGWMTWLTARAGEDGAWLLGVFAAFFFVLALAPLLTAPKKKKAPEGVPSTRFVPAWQMEGMILLTVLLVVAALLARCVHAAK
jgi:hypothetical protein